MITPELAGPNHTVPARAAPKAVESGSARPFAEFVAEKPAEDVHAPANGASPGEDVEVAPEAGAQSLTPASGGETISPVGGALVWPEGVFAAPATVPAPGEASAVSKGGAGPEVRAARGLGEAVPAEGKIVPVAAGAVATDGSLAPPSAAAGVVPAEGAAKIPAELGSGPPSPAAPPPAVTVPAEGAQKIPAESRSAPPPAAAQPAAAARQVVPSLSSGRTQAESPPLARGQEQALHADAPTAAAAFRAAPLAAPQTHGASVSPAAAVEFAPVPAGDGSAARAEPASEEAKATSAPAAPAPPTASLAAAMATALPAAAPAGASAGREVEAAPELRPLDQAPPEGEGAPPAASAPTAAPAGLEARLTGGSAGFGLEQLQSSSAPAWRLSAVEGRAPLEKAPAVSATPRDLAGQITLAVTQATQQHVELRLDPPELGRVQIRLNPTEAGGLQAVILADRPETQDFLRRNADTLVRDLTEAGYADVSLEFAAGGERASQDPLPEERFFAPAFEPTPIFAPAPEAPHRMPSGGLDIRL